MSTSSRIAGSAFSNVEYAKDTPLRLVMGVVVGVADKESNTSEGGPESRLNTAYNVSGHATRQDMQLINRRKLIKILNVKIKIQEINKI